MSAADASNLCGTTVARYTIAELVGVGGMGEVYLAHDPQLQRHVAIKVRHHHRDPRVPDDGELLAEARALSRLSHSHVAAIYDFVTDECRDYIVMEFVPGATLKELLTGGPLPFADVTRLGIQLMSGLAAAHTVRLVHCDIKPANLKVTAAGELKILDFGLAQLLPQNDGEGRARELSTHSASAFGPIGTMPYMSPEQLRGEPRDERSDVFSAGAVLYEMATGQQAFAQLQIPLLVDAILHQQPVAPSILNPRVPMAFDGVVGKAMEKWPARRYQSARELHAALQSLSAMPPMTASASVGRRLSSWISWSVLSLRTESRREPRRESAVLVRNVGV
jgi:serine/threonine protein kinase